MAQDRLNLRCKHCGETMSIFKIVAGGESLDMLRENNVPMPTLRLWMGAHIAHNPLAGEWLSTFGDAAQWFVLESVSKEVQNECI